jgi:hypothetical protein
MRLMQARKPISLCPSQMLNRIVRIRPIYNIREVSFLIICILRPTYLKNETDPIPAKHNMMNPWNINVRAHGNINGWPAMFQVGMPWVWVPMRPLNFLNLPNPSPAVSPRVYPASISSEYQNQKRKILGSRVQLTLKAGNLISTCEPKVSTMWDRQHLTYL